MKMGYIFKEIFYVNNEEYDSRIIAKKNLDEIIM